MDRLQQKASAPDAEETWAHMRICELPEEERPRECLEKYGPEALTDEQLIALLLNSGVQGMNVKALAEKFCSALCGDLRILRHCDMQDFLRFVARRASLKGIGEAKLCMLMAAQEFGARIFLPRLNWSAGRPFPEDPAAFAEAVAEYFFRESSRYNREGFWTLSFDSRRRIIGDGPQLITLGVGAHTVIDPPTLFRHGAMIGAHSIVLAHNHPSGNVTPSEADIETTRSLIRAGHALGISIIDHIIVGRPDRTPRYSSFRVRDICSFDGEDGSSEPAEGEL